MRDLLAQRHSCRDFLDDEVPHDVITELLETAQLTASWCNTQPWRIFVCRGNSARRLKAALRRAAEQGAAAPDVAFPPVYEGDHLARRRAAGFQLYTAGGVERGNREAARELALRNFDFFGAPHCLVVTTPAYLGPYAAIDCGGWIANFLLAAQARGVAAIAQAALAQQSPVLRRHLSIGEDLQILCGISFGYERHEGALNGYRTSRERIENSSSWHDA